jgi:hypothetical protein
MRPCTGALCPWPLPQSPPRRPVRTVRLVDQPHVRVRSRARFRTPSLGFDALPDDAVELVWRQARLVDGAALWSTCRRLRTLLREQRGHAPYMVRIGAMSGADSPCSLSWVVLQHLDFLPPRELRAYTYFIRLARHLRRLCLRADLGASAAPFMSAVRSVKLTHLSLIGAGLTKATVTALAACVSRIAPRTLELSAGEEVIGNAPFQLESTVLFGELAAVRRLRCVRLIAVLLTPVALCTLLRAVRDGTCAELLFAACQLGDGHMDAAVELFPRCRPLRRLAIEHNALSGAGVATLLGALARPDGKCMLTALSLRGSFDAMSGENGDAAAMNRFCKRQSQLARLDLSETNADSAFLARCAPGLVRLPCLRELALVANDIDDDGIATLATLPHLHDVNLSANTLVTLRGLVRAVHFCGVRELVLSHNRISLWGMNRLARAPILRVLESLTLADNGLCDSSMRALGLLICAAHRLTQVDLQCNNFTDVTLLHLLRCSLTIRQRTVTVDLEANDLSETWRGVANGSRHKFLI